MKLTTNVLKMVMAGAMLLNGTLAFAETSSVPVTIQEMNLREIKTAFDRLKQTQKESQNFHNALATATKTKGSWELRLSTGNQAMNMGTVVAITGGGAVYGMKLRPLSAFSQVGQKPTLAAVVIGGVAAVVGFYTADKATEKLVVAEADMQNARSNIAQLAGIMAEDAAFIKSRSVNLGATVNNNIVSYEGMPAAFNVFRSQFLNLNSN